MGTGGRGLLKAMQSLYVNCEARAEVGEKHLEWFEVEQGVI